MGDRGHVCVKGDSGAVYLYSHWGGSGLEGVLRDALGMRQRWDDPAYLARIIFCRMVRGEEGESTGFGISTAPCDSSAPVYLVDCAARKVTLTSGRPGAKPTKAWTFESLAAAEQGGG